MISMKTSKVIVVALVGTLLVIGLSACSTPDGDKLNSDAQSRFSQQARNLPDRLDTDQEKAYDEAQRKADMIKK